jgi:hypothetical protein
VLFEGDALIFSIFASFIGLALLIYGKRQARGPHLLVGFLLLVFPYFVGNALLIIAISAVLCALLWGAVRLGW